MLLKFLECFLYFYCIWKFSAVTPHIFLLARSVFLLCLGLQACVNYNFGCCSTTMDAQMLCLPLPWTAPPQHSHTHFFSIGVASWALSIEQSLNSPILFSLCYSCWWTCQKHSSSLVIMFFIPSVVGKITFLENIRVLISGICKSAMVYDDSFCSSCYNTLP